mgnify:CR=1 FL=1
MQDVLTLRSFRIKVLKSLLAKEKIAREALRMLFNIMLYAQEREALIFFEMLSSRKLFKKLLKEDNIPECILSSPLLFIFGKDLLKCVRMELGVKRIRFKEKDVIFFSYLLADLIFFLIKGKNKAK